MRVPILVNIAIPVTKPDGSVTEDISQAIMDFDNTYISGITKCIDNMAFYNFYDDRLPTKVYITFLQAMKIYEKQQDIDDRFKEEVRDYSKDNFNYLRNYDK